PEGRRSPGGRSPGTKVPPIIDVRHWSRTGWRATISRSSARTETSDMSIASTVIDHTGVRIGTVDASGAVLDHNGVRIGSVDAQGTVRDHNGVRIGRRG